MKKLAILIPAVAALLLAPTIAVAQGPHPGPHGPGHGPFDSESPFFLEHMLPRLAEQLELSDEQTAQIEEILDSELPGIRAMADELAAARDAYRENHDPADFDEAQFRAHAEAQVQTMVDLRVAIARTHAAIYQVLTPEQREQLKEKRSDASKRSFRHGSGRRPS